jgi:hypothetical protein
MKRFTKTFLILLIVAIFAMMALGSDAEEVARDAQQAGSEALDSLVDSDSAEAAETEEIITYNSYSARDLIKELDDNAMRAEEKHKGEYVEIDGYLGSIDSGGKYFDLDPSRDSYSFDSISCYVKTDEQKQTLMDLNKGDHIVVRGKITRVGEFLGYSMDVESIEKR